MIVELRLATKHPIAKPCVAKAKASANQTARSLATVAKPLETDAHGS